MRKIVNQFKSKKNEYVITIHCPSSKNDFNFVELNKIKLKFDLFDKTNNVQHNDMSGTFNLSDSVLMVDDDIKHIIKRIVLHSSVLDEIRYFTDYVNYPDNVIEKYQNISSLNYEDVKMVKWLINRINSINKQMGYLMYECDKKDSKVFNEIISLGGQLYSFKNCLNQLIELNRRTK